MPFNPDIIVTEPGSSHVLLIVEAKASEVSPEESEKQLKRYMWEMSCPVGLLVSPSRFWVYRNWFTGYSDDSIQTIGTFPLPRVWQEFEKSKSGAQFEAAVQSWLDNLRTHFESVELPKETREALVEHVVPSLIKGEVHAAGPRI